MVKDTATLKRRELEMVENTKQVIYIFCSKLSPQQAACCARALTYHVYCACHHHRQKLLALSKMRIFNSIKLFNNNNS
jgi:hypothetical protein